MTKQILIVDDEPNVAFMLSESLEDLGDNYSFDVAHTGGEAMEKIRDKEYDMIITDYNMPGMTGIDLAQAIRSVAPDTPVVLITGHGTEELREVANTLQLEGYLDKPFKLDQIRAVVKNAIKQTQQETPPPIDNKLGKAVRILLQDLHRHTGALCVLLISANGYPLEEVGHTNKLDVTTASTLVAANFLAAVELAKMLNTDSSMFKSSYYESDNYNLYSYDINGDFLLVVIFDATSKPGMVWFYTKKVATELRPLLAQQEQKQNWNTEEDLSESFDDSFDDMF